MTAEAFEKGFARLTAAFPSYPFHAKLYWEMLHDLDGGFFLEAVRTFIQTQRDLYQNTNVIAIIRELAQSKGEQLRVRELLKLEAETEQERIARWKREATPMPDDCRVALSKLGVKIDVNV